jgi:hypothetical protein
MADVTLIRQAERAGFIVLWHDGRAYYAAVGNEQRPQRWSFPYLTEDDAAIAAIAFADALDAMRAARARKLIGA